MAKIALTTLANLENENTAVSVINTNTAAITAAFENTLSRDGTIPNQMGSGLDMNSNRITNLPSPLTATEPLRLQDLVTFQGGGQIISDAGSLTTGTLPSGRLPPGVAVLDTSLVELWLGTGQSNMARAPNYSWAPPANAKIWNLTLATDGSVGTAFAALPTTTITFPNAFIADRAKKFPNKTIYLLNVSKDSNPIAQWLPGASSTPPLMDVYANIIANISGALAAAGLTTITGVLWWQGETDCANGSTTWRTDFETVVTRFQTNSWCSATIPWVICGIGGRNNNSNLANGGLAGDLFNSQYILPAVNASPQYRRYLDVAAWPYISATGVQYWESVTPDHFLGQGYFEAGGIASKSFYHDVGTLVKRTQQPMNLAGVSTIDSPVMWNFNNAATIPPINAGNVTTYIHAVGADAAIPIFDLDSFGIQGWTLLPRHAGGTLAAKTAVAAATPLYQLSQQTWDGSSFNTVARIAMRTVNAHTGSDHSSKLVIGTTPTGSTTLTDAFYFEPDGSFSVGQDVSAGAGYMNALNGFKINNVSIAGNLPATATNDSATAGHVGEMIQCFVAGNSATVTISNASPGVITETGHGMTTNKHNYGAVNFTTTGGLPTGLSVGTNYYLTIIDANTYKVSTSVTNAIAGTYVNTSSAGSGTHTAIHKAILTSSSSLDLGGAQLTGGDWDVTCALHFAPAATTNITALAASTTATTNTLDTTPGRLASFQFPSGMVTAGVGFTMPGATGQFLLSSTTNVFFEGFGIFTVSTMAAFGMMRARRVR